MESSLISNCDLDIEIDIIIVATAVAFGKLRSKVFWSHDLKLYIVYLALVLPNILYSSET